VCLYSGFVHRLEGAGLAHRGARMIAEGRVARPVEDGDDDGAHALDPVRAGLGPGDEGEAAQRPLALPAGQVPQEGEPAQAPARQERPRLVGPPIEGAGEGAAVEVVRGAGC
jgi:hypothetical protein